jgi:hypothetical protein
VYKLKLVFFIALVVYGPASGQSMLPICQQNNMAIWTDCQGAYTYSDGSKYVGEWKYNKRSGQGVATFSDGDKYIGEFLDGEFNGQGTYFFSNGEKQVGQFKDGKLNGKASKVNKTGKVFEQGIYEDDVLIKPMDINSSNFNDSGKDKKQKCLKLGLVDGTADFQLCMK